MLKGVWSWSTSIYSNQVVTAAAAAAAAAIEERRNNSAVATALFVVVIISCRYLLLLLLLFILLRFYSFVFSFFLSLDVHTHTVNLTPIDALKARHVHIG